MSTKMLIDARHEEETRVTIVRGSRVEEFDYENIARKQLKGSIYLARVTRVEPSLQAAFVEYGGNRHGFLAFSEIHPDYYQIPLADREDMIAEMTEAVKSLSREEQAREAGDSLDEDDFDDSAQPDDGGGAPAQDDLSPPSGNSKTAERQRGRRRPQRSRRKPRSGEEIVARDSSQPSPVESNPEDNSMTSSDQAAAGDESSPSRAKSDDLENSDNSKNKDIIAEDTGANKDANIVSEPAEDGSSEIKSVSTKPVSEDRSANPNLDKEPDLDKENIKPKRRRTPSKKKNTKSDTSSSKAETDSDVTKIVEKPTKTRRRPKKVVTSDQEIKAGTDKPAKKVLTDSNTNIENVSEGSSINATKADETTKDGMMASDSIAAIDTDDSITGSDMEIRSAQAIETSGNSDTSVPDSVLESVSQSTIGSEDNQNADKEILTEQERVDHVADHVADHVTDSGDAIPNDKDQIKSASAKPEPVIDKKTIEAIVRRRMLKSMRRRYAIQDVIKKRQILLVQVAKEERGNKGAALTTYISLAGRYCVLMPNSTHSGGVSRKISAAIDRRRLKGIIKSLSMPADMGLIIRTAGMTRTKSEIKRDYDYLLRLWNDIRTLTLTSTAPAAIYEEADLIRRSIRDMYTRDVDEILVEGERGYRAAKDFMKLLVPSHAKKVQHYKDRIPLFHRFQVESQLESMFLPSVSMKSGGYVVFNPTEALISVDVNSGRSTREHNIEETALKTNLEAADEIARQLRLRDMAGLVVIDFIDMEDRANIRAVEKRMRDAINTDRARIQIGKISSFGLMEMSRQRLRPNLLEASTIECSHCKGMGIVLSLEAAALLGLRKLEEEAIRARSASLDILCSPDVTGYLLNSKRSALFNLERTYGVTISVVAEMHRGASEIELRREPGLPTIDPESLTAIQAEPIAEAERNTAETVTPGVAAAIRPNETSRADLGADLASDSINSKTTDSAELVGDDSPHLTRANSHDSSEETDDQKGKRRRRRRRRGGRRTLPENGSETKDSLSDSDGSMANSESTTADNNPIEPETKQEIGTNTGSEEKSSASSVPAKSLTANDPSQSKDVSKEQSRADDGSSHEDRPRRRRSRRGSKTRQDENISGKENSAKESPDQSTEASKNITNNTPSHKPESEQIPSGLDQPAPRRRVRRRKTDTESSKVENTPAAALQQENTAEKGNTNTAKIESIKNATEPQRPVEEPSVPQKNQPASSVEIPVTLVGEISDTKPKKKGWWRK